MSLNPPEILDLVPAISDQDIQISLGVEPGKRVRRRLERLITEVGKIARDVARPQLTWRTGTAQSVADAFPPSRRLNRYLVQPEFAAIVAATVGPAMATRIENEEDPMKAYVLSAAATSIARSALVQARRKIAQEFPDYKIADSLSPGTDGLPFRLQKSLLERLPVSELGISLDEESMLMTPLASVTGIIAWGHTVEREEPISSCGELIPKCARCPSNNCQLRVQAYIPNLATAV